MEAQVSNTPAMGFMAAYTVGTRNDDKLTTGDSYPLRTWREKDVQLAVFALDDYVVCLRQITSMDHGKRNGSACLDWLCRVADRHAAIIVGWIEPNVDAHLDEGQLAAWYARHGFEVGGEKRISWGGETLRYNAAREPSI